MLEERKMPMALLLCLILHSLSTLVAGNCLPPDPPEDGIIVGTAGVIMDGGMGYDIGDTIKFACNPGFGLAGADEAVCLADGQFSEDPPFCVAITCRRPTIENGIVVVSPTSGSAPPPGAYLAGTTVTVRCNEGFSMVPPDSRPSKCLDNGQWGPTLASCKSAKSRCRVPPTPNFARVASKAGNSGDGYFASGGFIEFKCEDGYEAQGPKQLVCLVDGEWSDVPPNCVVSSAAPPPSLTCSGYNVPNGDVSPSRTQYQVGNTITIFCHDGFVVSPSWASTATCGDDGIWSPISITCNVRPTLAPTTQRTVQTNEPIYSPPSYQPPPPPYYQPPPSPPVYRSPPPPPPPPPSPPSSVAVCPPVKVDFGEVWPADGRYEAGTMINLYCHSGYHATPLDADWSICQRTGRWQPAIGKCSLPQTTPAPPPTKPLSYTRVQSCSLPVSPPHSRVILSKSLGVGTPGLFSVGSRVLYSCEDGYVLTDGFSSSPSSDPPLQITLDCMDTGNWSQPTPTCVPNENAARLAQENSQILNLFQNSYWSTLPTTPKYRLRACEWGGVAEILPDPDSKFRALVVCASGAVLSVPSNCSASLWKAVIGPPRGIVGWNQDPFYAAALDPNTRDMYFTSSVKQLGILSANLDIIISAATRGATVLPQYVVSGRKEGPLYEGLAVDPESRTVFSSDGAARTISAYAVDGGLRRGFISKPFEMRQFQPRHLALGPPGGPQNRSFLAVADYVNSQVLLFLVNKDNFTFSEYAGSVASFSTGRCDPGSIGRPGDVKFDIGGNLIVADGGCGRAQIFAADPNTRRQPFRSGWVSRNLGQYVSAALPTLSRYNPDGSLTTEPKPAVMAGLSTGEVVCFISES